MTGPDAPPSARDLEIQIARLEHALARVADDAAEPDAQADAAEQAAHAAGEAAAALDRTVREAGGGA